MMTCSQFHGRLETVEKKSLLCLLGSGIGADKRHQEALSFSVGGYLILRRLITYYP